MQAHNNKTKARLSILVADDQVDTVTTLAALLRSEGHTVHTCANASLVIKSIERFKPDVCILDIVMPGKTGFSLARDVHAMQLKHRPVLVAISGVFNSYGDDVVATSAGFDYFVRKDKIPNELVALIDRLAGDAAPPTAA